MAGTSSRHRARYRSLVVPTVHTSSGGSAESSRCMVNSDVPGGVLRTQGSSTVPVPVPVMRLLLSLTLSRPPFRSVGARVAPAHLRPLREGSAPAPDPHLARPRELPLVPVARAPRHLPAGQAGAPAWLRRPRRHVHLGGQRARGSG